MFLLVRHGETNWQLTVEKGLIGLQQDFVPLTEHGKRQAEKAAADSRLQDAEIILSSPYTRALQTASIINTSLRLPLIVEFDLHETLPDRRRLAHSVEKTLKFCKDFDDHFGEHPEGEEKPWESLTQTRKRVLPLLKQYDAYEKVIIVCHEKVIKSLVGWREIPHCSITPYSIESDQ